MRTEATEPLAALAQSIGRRDRPQVFELPLQVLVEQASSLVVVFVRATLGLGYDRVDDAEPVTRGGGRLERSGRESRFARVAPQDRCATLGRDDRIRPVGQDQHAVGDADRERATRRALSDDDRDRGNPDSDHRRDAPRDRTTLATLLGPGSGECSRCVDERHERDVQLFGERHDAPRLAIALGARHTEIAVRALLGVPALLLTDERHRLVVIATDAAHNGRIVAKRPVSAQLLEVSTQPRDVVERVRPILVACELDRVPAGGRVLGRALDLVGDASDESPTGGLCAH